MRQHSPRCLMAARTFSFRTSRNLHPVLGHQLLQQLVGPETQLHVVRVGPDHASMSSSTIKSTEFCHSPVSSSRVSGARPSSRPLPPQHVEIGQPLRGVNARQGDERVARRETPWRCGTSTSRCASLGQRMFAKDAGQHARGSGQGQGSGVRAASISALAPSLTSFSGDAVTSTWLPKILLASGRQVLELHRFDSRIEASCDNRNPGRKARRERPAWPARRWWCSPGRAGPITRADGGVELVFADAALFGPLHVASRSGRRPPRPCRGGFGRRSRNSPARGRSSARPGREYTSPSPRSSSCSHPPGYW